jgi:chromosome segregation ATPase
MPDSAKFLERDFKLL